MTEFYDDGTPRDGVDPLTRAAILSVRDRALHGSGVCAGSHFVPEGWEDIDVGVCPRCGLAVRWDEDDEVWVDDPTLRILVLTTAESDSLMDRLEPTTDLFSTIEAQLNLQEE